MKLNNSNKNNFWNNHTLNDFQRLVILKNIHSYEISSICFLKDGRIASSSEDHYVLIYNKITFKIEIRIKEKKRINYMNINKDGILITCLSGTFLNLYEIKGKRYKTIQKIRPYSLYDDIKGIFENFHTILKFIELKNGDIAILLWAYAISFYKKNKNKKYSYLNQFNENIKEYTSDLCELDNNQYCISIPCAKQIRFLDMNSKKITNIIKVKAYFILKGKTQFLLMNKNDLLFAGRSNITIIDIQKKEIIKYIELLGINGLLSSMYKLSNNRILLGFWKNYIEQLEYDEIKKELKVISKTSSKDYNNYDLFAIYSISIFNNILMAVPYDNKHSYSSILVYKLKNK